jgi:uncharacterized membrane protein YkvA (DUF1232 family)
VYGVFGYFHEERNVRDTVAVYSPTIPESRATAVTALHSYLEDPVDFIPDLSLISHLLD